MFKKLASPALRKQMEHKETGAAAGKHPVKGLEEQEEEEVKEASMTGEQGEVRPMRAATTTPAVGGKGPGGLGVEESTGMRAGTAGGGAARGEMGGLDVEEASDWTGAEWLDIPHKTTVGPKMETPGKPPTEEKPSQPTPAATTTADEGLEEEEEEEMHMPQTPFTTPAMAVAAAADTSQGATKAPFASDLYRASSGPAAGGKAKAPPSEEAAAVESAQEAYRPGLSVLPPHGMGGPSPGEVSKMKPAGTERKEEKEKAAPTPMQQEIRGPLAPSAEAPTFGTTAHAATTAPSPGLAGSFSPDIGGGAAGLEGGPEAQPTTFETTPAAGGLVGLGTVSSSSSSSPLLGTSAAGVGSTLGKKLEETVVAPEEAGAAVGPSAGVALPSPAEAAEAINRGIEGGEHVLETVARRFLTSIREHAPSLASLGAAANVGIENVEQSASEVEGFIESVISKTAAGIRARLPSPAQGLETTNAGVEQVGLVAERAERIAQDTVEHAARAIRARFPSPAQGAEQANMAVEKAADWVGHAERIAEDVASRAVAAVHEMLPSPAKGLAATNEGIAAGERMVKSAAGTLLEKLPSPPSAPTTGTTTATTTGGTTGTTAASILSPAAILDTVNRGIEAAAETVKGVLPGASTSTSTSTTAETPFSGLSIKAPIESVKAMMPSTPFPTPVAGTETGAETGAGLSSALSPAAIAESINKCLERGGEAVRGPMETTTETLGALPTLLPSPAQAAEAINRGIEQGGEAVSSAAETAKQTVGGAFASLPTILPSPVQAAETINRAIDTGAPTQGTGEQGWEGEAGAGGGRKTAGFGEAYDQRAREAEARRMLEEAEHAAPHEQGGVVTGAVPAGTRQLQPRTPQASLFGAVENVLESMHEAFARGVRMTGFGAREQPTPMVSKEEVEMGAEEGLGAKAPVVIQEELTMETEGAAGEVQTVHVSKTIIK